MKQIPAVLTTLTLEDAIAAFYQGFLTLVGAPPNDLVLSILVAQSALETGNWHKAFCYNFGNARPDAHSEFFCQFKCGEFVGGKQVIYVPPDSHTDFRAFTSPEAGMLDHLHLLMTHWPESWNALLRGELVEFVHLLHDQPTRKHQDVRGYFTAPLLPYIRGVSRLQAMYIDDCTAFVASRTQALASARAAAASPAAEEEIDLFPELVAVRGLSHQGADTEPAPAPALESATEHDAPHTHPSSEHSMEPEPSSSPTIETSTPTEVEQIRARLEAGDPKILAAVKLLPDGFSQPMLIAAVRAADASTTYDPRCHALPAEAPAELGAADVGLAVLKGIENTPAGQVTPPIDQSDGPAKS